MDDNIYTLEQVADHLQLHVKTVRRYVREGRLPAARVGKQYRVTAEDLAEFSGVTSAPHLVTTSRQIENNAVVDITAINPDDASRIANTLMAALQGHSGQLRADTLYYEESARLKVILHGDLAATTELLQMLQVLLGNKSS